MYKRALWFLLRAYGSACYALGRDAGYYWALRAMCNYCGRNWYGQAIGAVFNYVGRIRF